MFSLLRTCVKFVYRLKKILKEKEVQERERKFRILFPDIDPKQVDDTIIRNMIGAERESKGDIMNSSIMFYLENLINSKHSGIIQKYTTRWVEDMLKKLEKPTFPGNIEIEPDLS